MRVIFLDLDGVLVTRRPTIMEDNLLRNLARVVHETGAQIVLSSDWRRHPEARAAAKQALASVGLVLIGCTPCKSPYLAQRPTEIMEWKREYMRRPGAEKWESWIAIDDRDLLNEQHGRHLRGHFLQTHPMRGLTAEAADQCIAILKQDQSTMNESSGDPLTRSTSVELSISGRPEFSDEDFDAPRLGGRASASPTSHISAMKAARALQAAGGGATATPTGLAALAALPSAAAGSRTAPAAAGVAGRVRGRSMGARR
mmetsp:Transcript_72200/g.159746  ORF Transcript_72200/g.159746 Transcript_72200/m.159746 type:complete len:257 (+) Transcript_72200:41-811(+)